MYNMIIINLLPIINHIYTAIPVISAEVLVSK